MVDSKSIWILYFAYTCDGQFIGMGDPAVVFTMHNTVTGVDSTPVVQPGPWGYRSYGVTGDYSQDAQPAGMYVLRVAVANPAAHKCQWSAAVNKR